jgi:hypothetical protein
MYTLQTYRSGKTFSMQFAKLFTIFALAAAASAFTLPDDAQEGVYQVSFDDKGNQVHVAINETFNFAAVEAGVTPSRIFGRQKHLPGDPGTPAENEMRCGCGSELQNKCV